MRRPLGFYEALFWKTQLLRAQTALPFDICIKVAEKALIRELEAKFPGLFDEKEVASASESGVAA